MATMLHSVQQQGGPIATSDQINPNKIEQVLPPQIVPFQNSLLTVRPLYELVVELFQATNKKQN